MKNISFVAFVGAILVASGCDNDKEALMTFTPNKLDSCESVSEVIVRWDLRNKYPEIQNVKIYVADGNTETLFAEAGSFGEVKTGKWVKPSIPVFIMKDRVTDRVIDKAAVAGPPCK